MTESPGRRRGLLIDAVAAASLLALAVVVRRRGLPTSGLWYDDAWVVAGATKASPSQLLLVSTSHPGFSALLMLWSRLVSERADLMVMVPFAVGVATVPLVYAFLRRLAISRPVSLFASALLAIAAVHSIYSGRAKPYVVEALAVLVLATVVPVLTRRRWTAWTGAAWLVGALLVGTLSAFCLLATAVAAVVVVLHPERDRGLRAIVAMVQGGLQVAYFAVVQRRFDSGQLSDDWDEKYDGYLHLGRGPVDVAHQVGDHLRRLGAAFPGGPPWIALAGVVLALAGLGFAAWRGDRTVPARFLLGLIVAAVVGSTAGLVPFGPDVRVPVVSPGTRASVWLIAPLVVGLAIAIDAATSWIVARLEPARAALGVGLVVGALAIGGFGGLAHNRRVAYPPYISDTPAVAYINRTATAGDVVFVFSSSEYGYASQPGPPVGIEADRRSIVGFEPVLRAPRFVWGGDGARVAQQVGTARRVLLYVGFKGFGDADRAALEARLTALGFVAAGTHGFGVASVSEWTRSA